jgi:hypothetical protein
MGGDGIPGTFAIGFSCGKTSLMLRWARAAGGIRCFCSCSLTTCELLDRMTECRSVP